METSQQCLAIALIKCYLSWKGMYLRKRFHFCTYFHYFYDHCNSRFADETFAQDMRDCVALEAFWRLKNCVTEARDVVRDLLRGLSIMATLSQPSLDYSMNLNPPQTNYIPSWLRSLSHSKVALSSILQLWMPIWKKLISHFFTIIFYCISHLIISLIFFFLLILTQNIFLNRTEWWKIWIWVIWVNISHK